MGDHQFDIVFQKYKLSIVSQEKVENLFIKINNTSIILNNVANEQTKINTPVKSQPDKSKVILPLTNKTISKSTPTTTSLYMNRLNSALSNNYVKPNKESLQSDSGLYTEDPSFFNDRFPFNIKNRLYKGQVQTEQEFVDRIFSYFIEDYKIMLSNKKLKELFEYSETNCVNDDEGYWNEMYDISEEKIDFDQQELKKWLVSYLQNNLLSSFKPIYDYLDRGGSDRDEYDESDTDSYESEDEEEDKDKNVLIMKTKIIKRNIWGNFEDPDTNIISDKVTGKAIGIQNHKSGAIEPLQPKHIDICNKYGWKYDENDGNRVKKVGNHYIDEKRFCFTKEVIPIVYGILDKDDITVHPLNKQQVIDVKQSGYKYYYKNSYNIYVNNKTREYFLIPRVSLNEKHLFLIKCASHILFTGFSTNIYFAKTFDVWLSDIVSGLLYDRYKLYISSSLEQYPSSGEDYDYINFKINPHTLYKTFGVSQDALNKTFNWCKCREHELENMGWNWDIKVIHNKYKRTNLVTEQDIDLYLKDTCANL
jgi:hypothetical protein